MEQGAEGWRANKGPQESNKTGFRAVGHRVLLLDDPVEEVTASGLIMPKKAVDKERMAATIATVIEIGHDCWCDKRADFCQVGQKVLIGMYTGKLHTSPVDGKDYRFINDLDVISPIEDQPK